MTDLALHSLPDFQHGHLELVFVGQAWAAECSAGAAGALEQLLVQMDGKVAEASHSEAVERRIL